MTVLRGAGLGLRPPYFRAALAGDPRVAFWEVVTENLMVAGGHPRRIAFAAREHAPIVLHGVSLSIGSADPLSEDYLARLRVLVEELEPALVSDHLCWSGIDGRSAHDLWPLPATEAALAHVASRVHAVQDRVRRQILLENPASYARFPTDEMTEHAFFAELVRRTGCGILLDVSNLHVSAENFGWDAEAYVRALPAGAVQHVHLAGHTKREEMLLDTHDRAICEATWELYAFAMRELGTVATSIERDDRIPPLDELVAELDKIRAIQSGPELGTRSSGPEPEPQPDSRPEFATASTSDSDPFDPFDSRNPPSDLIREQRAFYAGVVGGGVLHMNGAPTIYREMYALRLRDSLRADFPALHALLGDAVLDRYVAAEPPTSFTLRELGRALPAFARTLAAPPWASELAALELARLDAFDAIDEVPLSRAELASRSPDAFAARSLRWIAASSLLACEWDVDRAHAELAPPVRAARTLVVWRTARGLHQRALTADELACADLLAHTAPIHLLADRLGDPVLLVTLLERWIDDGLVVAA